MDGHQVVSVLPPLAAGQAVHGGAADLGELRQPRADAVLVTVLRQQGLLLLVHAVLTTVQYSTVQYSTVQS